MSKSKEKKDAQEMEKKAFSLYESSVADSKKTADELASTHKDRTSIADLIANRSMKFLKDDEAGKDVTSMIPNELKRLNDASNLYSQTSKMQMNTGARKQMGSPNANYQAQIDASRGLEEKDNFANSALDAYMGAKQNAESSGINAQQVVSNDAFNIANVRGGQASTQGNFWKDAQAKNVEVQNRQGWFSKYVMPLAVAGASGVTSWLSGGAKK